MTIQTEDLREQVARIIKRAVYEGGFVEEHTDAILRLVSSTKGGGDQEDLCDEPSSDASVSASPAADVARRSLPYTRPGRIFHDGHGLIWAPSLKGGDTRIADVRGWGYLTGGGHGALNLPGDVALATQLAWGDAIADALNSRLAAGQSLNGLAQDGSSQQKTEPPPNKKEG